MTDDQRTKRAADHNRLKQDVANAEAALERAEAHARRLRDVRDSLMAELAQIGLNDK